MCRSGIAGAGTTVVQEFDAGKDGAQQPQTTPEIDCGGGAGVEANVSRVTLFFCLFFLFCFSAIE